jgi:hypothetical protein
MKPPAGYIAIASLLVITALLTLIGTTVSLLSIDEGLTALSFKDGAKTLAIAQACAEEALLKINESGVTPSSVDLPLGSCTVTEIETSGTLHRFEVSVTDGAYAQSIYLEADRQTVLKVNRWREN